MEVIILDQWFMQQGFVTPFGVSWAQDFTPVLVQAECSAGKG
jgi:hypothetical protein